MAQRCNAGAGMGASGIGGRASSALSTVYLAASNLTFKDNLPEAVPVSAALAQGARTAGAETEEVAAKHGGIVVAAGLSAEGTGAGVGIGAILEESWCNGGSGGTAAVAREVMDWVEPRQAISLQLEVRRFIISC